MTESYPFPNETQYHAPTTPLEVLREEQKLYPDAISMRAALYGLMRLYAPSPLAKSCGDAARLMRLVDVQQDRATHAERREYPLNIEFMYGEISALHAHTSTLEPRTRAKLYQVSIPSYSLETGHTELTEAAARMEIETMQEYRDEYWQYVFEAMPEELQYEVLETANIVCPQAINTPLEKERRFASDTFAAGYAYEERNIAKSKIHLGIRE